MPRSTPTGQAKYLMIATELRDAVLSGGYPPGARLPGENQIMADHKVARATARQALGQLVNWGVAESRKGSGVYVREFKPIIRDGIRRLGTDTWPAGQSIWSADTASRDLAIDQLEVTDTTDVPDRIRALLDLEADASAITRSRRFVLDGKPVLLARSWLPASLASGTAIAQPDTGPGGTYARLQELGHAPVRFREDLRALMPGPVEIERLEMPSATPVVELVRVAYDAQDHPVEVNEMTADAGSYVFRYDFDV